jgi:hypothetical protein
MQWVDSIDATTCLRSLPATSLQLSASFKWSVLFSGSVLPVHFCRHWRTINRGIQWVGSLSERSRGALKQWVQQFAGSGVYGIHALER